MPAELISVLVIIVIMILYCLISKWIKYYRAVKIRDWTSWCVIENSNVYRNSLPLRAYIHNAQNKAALAPQYRIVGDEEWEYVNEILTGFKTHLTQAYFYDEIPYQKSIYNIPGEHFFMFNLFCYLSNHHCDSIFLGNEMHSQTIEYNRLGSWGVPLYDAIYEMSEFGLVLYKLYYVTYCFCVASPFYKKNIAGWLSPEHFTEVIDSKQIRISRL